MSEIQVASRYAKSLIDLAKEQSSIEQVKADIEIFVATCKANPLFAAVLKNPVIGPQKKIAILKALFAEKLSPVVLSFFAIMVNKGRGEVLFGAGQEFIHEYDQLKGIVKATVVSAAPLSETNKAELAAIVKDVIKGEVRLETKVNPALIGGFVLTVGDRQVDTSIASSLQKLKKDFAQKVMA